jgi:hypothetical protein
LPHRMAHKWSCFKQKGHEFFTGFRLYKMTQANKRFINLPPWGACKALIVAR